MRVGLDQFTLHPYNNWDPFFAIQWVREQKLDGLQFGGIGGMSPGLDKGRLKEIQAECDRHGLYHLVSVSSPNPQAGKGGRKVDDVVAGLTKEIEAAASLGWRELHSTLGGLDERMGVPVPWTQHLAASVEALVKLKPVLKANGCRINLEDHGDATTFDLVRLARQIGPEVLGICLDTANVLCHCEDPVEAARRAAPYVHQTHIKDGIVYFSANGYTRQGRPPGQGVIPWEEVLAALAAFNPNLCLSIEDHKWVWEFRAFDADWLGLHPDITAAEMGKFMKTCYGVSQRIAKGELPDPVEYEKIPYKDQIVERVASGRDHLRSVIAKLGVGGK